MKQPDRFFSYDQGADGFLLHATLEEAKKTAEESLSDYRDEAVDPNVGWDDYVDLVCCGVITHSAKEKIDHPKEPLCQQYDDSNDGNGYTDYTLEPILSSEPISILQQIVDSVKEYDSMNLHPACNEKLWQAIDKAKELLSREKCNV